MKSYILDYFKNNPEVVNLNANKDISDNSWIQQALVVATSYHFNPRPIVYVCQNLYNAQRFYERLISILDEDSCVLFGVEDSLRVEAIASSPEMMAAKVEALNKIIHDNAKIIVCNSSALIRYLPNIEVFKECCIEIKIDKEIEMEDLKMLLIRAGYQQVTHVDTPLTFALRGGIIDVYSINYDNPIRIEFFDNIIDSIRFFDCLTQKTIENIKEANIICASDILFSDAQVEVIEAKAKAMLDNLHNDELRDNIEIDLGYLKNHICENHLYAYYTFLDDTNSLLDYVGKCEVILNDSEAINKMIHDVISDNTVYIQEMVQENKLLPRFSHFYDLTRVLMNHEVINSDPYGDNISNILNINIPKQSLELNIKMLSTSDKPVILFLKDNEFTQVINVCVNMQIVYNLEDSLKPGINLIMDNLFEGFEVDDFIVVTSYELFETKPRLSRFANKFKNAQVINSYQELEPGDYIVHTQHGVGQYMGIETKKIMGYHKDFLRIVYKGNAELLVPLEQFKLVRKFVSSQGVVPRLNKLGSDEWTKTKEKLQGYKKAGINRLSIGLQAAQDRLLKQIGRIHTYKEFEQTYNWAKEVGFQNINVDLMLGLPNQSIQDLKESLEKVIANNPTHISTYSLIVEEGAILENKISKGELELPSEELERQMYWYVKNTLELNGYIHYEISNLAKKGKESKHNMNCWKQKQYVGIGVAAHSYLNQTRYSNTEKLEEYIANMKRLQDAEKDDGNESEKNRNIEKRNADIYEIYERQTIEDTEKEYMLLGLRKIAGVSIQEFKNKFVQNPLFLFRNEIEKLTREGLIMVDGDFIRLTNKGIDFANLVWEEFV